MPDTEVRQPDVIEPQELQRQIDEVRVMAEDALDKFPLRSTTTPGATRERHIHDLGKHLGLDSGTYTPTLTNGTNVAASTAYESQFIRVGAIVCVSGKVDVDPTSATSETLLGLSLPFASNLGAQEDASGVCSQAVVTALSAGSIIADFANDRAELRMHPSGSGNAGWFFIFQYQVI